MIYRRRRRRRRRCRRRRRRRRCRRRYFSFTENCDCQNAVDGWRSRFC